MKEVVEVKNCRSCNSEKLKEIVNFGDQYVVDFVKSKNEGIKCPLELVLCEDCKLLQLRHNAPAESMWGEQYWYKSGISTTIKQNLKEITNEIEEKINLSDGDIVIDIGCNDGTLLDSYKKRDLFLIGFEPSKNVAGDAEKKGYRVINDFFNAESFKRYFGEKKVKVITAISMFYDLENPNKFLQDITSILDKDGLFVIQQNYLVSMLEQNAFDNVCHEHREYYSLISMKPLLEKYGLEIFDISLNDINGGSIRTLIKFKDGNEGLENVDGKKRLENQIKREIELNLDTPKPYLEFALRIEKIKNDLMNFLKEEKSRGKKIWAYGASTRGLVVLQYFGINQDLVEYVADKNPDKFGRMTVGNWIPITSPENMRAKNPDIILVMVWHFFDEIIKQERELLDGGANFVVALPNFKIFKK